MNSATNKVNIYVNSYILVCKYPGNRMNRGVNIVYYIILSSLLSCYFTTN